MAKRRYQGNGAIRGWGDDGHLVVLVPNGGIAATSSCETDRKTGDWSCFDEDGNAMDRDTWDRKFSEFDWALDDRSGTPREENRPLPAR